MTMQISSHWIAYLGLALNHNCIKTTVVTEMCKCSMFLNLAYILKKTMFKHITCLVIIPNKMFFFYFTYFILFFLFFTSETSTILISFIDYILSCNHCHTVYLYHTIFIPYTKTNLLLIFDATNYSSLYFDCEGSALVA